MTESIQTETIILNIAYAFRSYMTQSMQTETIMLSIACMLFVPTRPKADKPKEAC